MRLLIYYPLSSSILGDDVASHFIEKIKQWEEFHITTHHHIYQQTYSDSLLTIFHQLQ